MADDNSGDIFGDYKSQGWGGLQDLMDPGLNMTPEQQADWEEKQQLDYDLNAAIHRCFTTADGQTVLEFFRELATECQRFDVVNETNPLMACAKGIFREGQAAMYFEFTKRMRLAMQGPPAARE
jgi:hypothetical protein